MLYRLCNLVPCANQERVPTRESDARVKSSSYVSRIATILIASSIGVGMLNPSAHADIIWAYSASSVPDRIDASDSNGSDFRSLWTSPNPGGGYGPWGVAVNSVTRRVFWSDTVARSISSASLVGGGEQVHFTYTGPVSSLAVDPQSNWIYFVSSGVGIVRGNLDGSVIETVASIGTANSWLTIDSVNRYLYFTESANNRIGRLSLDGTPTIETVLSGTGTGTGARGLVVSGDSVYWLNGSTDFLYRGSLTTGTIETLVNLSELNGGVGSTTNGLTTDGEFLYWTEGQTNLRGVYRSDLNGNGATRIIDAGMEGSPLGIASFNAIPEPTSGFVLLGIASVMGLIRRK